MTVAERLINMTDDGKVTLHFVHDFLAARLSLLKTIKVSSLFPLNSMACFSEIC